MYATVAFNITGGNILKWFRDMFGRNEIEIARQTGRDPYDLLLEQMPDDPTGLLVLPYFTPSGTPYFDPLAKGAVIGLDLSTSRGEFIKALLEGTVFEMKLNLEILEKSGYQVNELRAIGGGAKSKAWNQLKADILGKAVTVPNITEAGCMGAAMLAKAAHTKINVAEIADEWVKPLTKLYPEKKKEYDQKFTLYKELYPMLKNTFF
jgi:xylulokinase